MNELEAFVQEHWNQRATLGAAAGTNDLIAKELEQRAILQAFADCRPKTVLEVGCGTGETAHRLASAYPESDIVAVDYAPQMIQAAQQRPPLWNLRFAVAGVDDLPNRLFDCIYTQRCLINLPGWAHQRRALLVIASRLAEGGRFLMCENSMQGLCAINHARWRSRLPMLVQPWHNHYFPNYELSTVTCLKLVACVEFSSTYYFLSRVVNARIAKWLGKEPRYDAWINRVASKLPSVGPWSQGRLWIWEKP